MTEPEQAPVPPKTLKKKRPPRKKGTTKTVEIVEVSKGELDKLSEENEELKRSNEELGQALLAMASPEAQKQMAPTVYSDLFKVESKDFDGDMVKGVILPKFLMKKNKLEDKSNVILAFHGDPKLYAQLLNIVTTSKIGKIKIHMLKNNEGEVAATIVFPRPVVKAVDFGTLSTEREDLREVRIEIDFSDIEIDESNFKFD